MQSLNTDVVKEMIEGFRRVGFYIFNKDIHQDVSKIIREVNLHHTVRIKILNPKRGLFIVDVDPRTYDMECRDKCLAGDILDHRCYAECKEEMRINYIKLVVSKLNSILSNVGRK